MKIYYKKSEQHKNVFIKLFDIVLCTEIMTELTSERITLDNNRFKSKPLDKSEWVPEENNQQIDSMYLESAEIIEE